MNLNELLLCEQNGQLQGAYTKEDVSIELYHDPKCPAVSKSALDLIARFPLAYKYKYIDQKEEPKDETPAFRLGKAVHVAVLEQELFSQIYCTEEVIKGFENKRTKEYKENFERFQFENPNKIILTMDEKKIIDGIMEQINLHPIARNLIKNGFAEQSLFWKETISVNEKEVDVMCKTRCDYIRNDNFIIDLKTIDNIMMAENSIADYRYYVQEAMLRIGANRVYGRNFKVIFLVVEKKAPHGIRIINLASNPAELSNAQILGEKHFKRDLEKFYLCKQANDYPNYQVNGKYCIETIELPKWLYYFEERQG